MYLMLQSSLINDSSSKPTVPVVWYDITSHAESQEAASLRCVIQVLGCSGQFRRCWCHSYAYAHAYGLLNASDAGEVLLEPAGSEEFQARNSILMLIPGRMAHGAFLFLLMSFTLHPAVIWVSLMS